MTTLPSSRQSLCYNSLQVPASARDGRLFCAGDLTGKRDSCSGDSGGPIFCLRENNMWELSGIVSFGGERCAQQSIPGAYTTISYYLNWIQTTMHSMLLASQPKPTPRPTPSFPILSPGAYPTRRPPPYAPAPAPSRYSNSWHPQLSANRLSPMVVKPTQMSSMRNRTSSSSFNSRFPVVPTERAAVASGGRNQAALLNLLQILLSSFNGKTPSASEAESKLIANYLPLATTQRNAAELDLP